MSDSATDRGLLELPVHGLKPGMYVAELDRPWLETPFALQGFLVRNDEDILSLAEHCSRVFVDTRRSGLPRNAADNAEQHQLRAEFTKASADYESAGAAVRKVFKQLAQSGELDVAAVQKAISPLITTVVTHRDALAALARMKRKDDYLYNHSIATAVWAALIGQHVGLDRDTLASLALGAALLDLGKVQLPDALLHKPGMLTSRERAQMESHVTLGLQLATADGTDDEVVLQVIGLHHERFDGTGYPEGLVGPQIPLVAQIAGLADSYDAMLTPRAYARPHTSFTAVQELIDLQGMLFSKPLVEQFVQAVGLFPTGALVELNTGEVGVVVAQNPVRRLRPKVMLVLDAEHRRQAQLVTIDLMKYASGTGHADALWIVKELEQGAYGLSPTEFFL